MTPDRKCVLVVDDERALRAGVAQCVAAMGHAPLTAADGEEALRLVDEHHPALIILDVMMPGLSGIEVCRRLRGNPATRALKIMFLSARGQIHEQEQGLDAGADCYVTKPFEMAELIGSIQRLLGEA